MKKYIIFSLMLTLSLSLMADPPEVSKKFKKEVVNFFNDETIEIVEIKELSANNDIFFQVLSNNKKLGLVVLTSAKGRFEYFDYMIIYNQQLEIELIKILVYRSDHGSEIMAKRWLSQFYSKKADSFNYGSDIQAISGATFSASSLTENVNRINKILKEYNHK